MKTTLLQILFSNGIILLLLSLCMITSIDFYDKTFMLRNEINDVISNDELTIKSCPNI